ncbi:MAG: 5'-deoxynucleotidase [Lachnospiraceae bacterium]|nr:5'-deoxynucleotidase [Lachnospiraceae bacterium]MBQ2577234.1 5'-deoxynucleotidase [Lachnospiraceae bacterium]MEE3355604.1 5'-deoxynucleotidase [Candidatus Weimeria sp.]
MEYTFFAAISRMKYINRWSQMRSSREETLSEHSLDVAMIAHGLCTIANVRYGKHLDANKAALIGLYHDASEIITGDMPTPVKYANEDIRDAYKAVEAKAELTLIHRLPQDLQEEYRGIFRGEDTPEDAYMRRLVKGADKLSAYIKCIEEEKAGNTEFRTAKETIRRSLDGMVEQLPEMRDFVEEFLPSYGKTLDELSS